jgi:PAS domain S-box-containing protein
MSTTMAALNLRAFMERSDRYLASLTEEGRYRLLVEAVTDYAIYLLDPSGMVTTWNPGAQRFKGYTANEIIGQHFSLFYSEGDKKIGLPARALEIAKREGKFEAEGWRVRKDGSRFWAYVIIDPIRDPAGTIVGFAKVTRDLTERKKAEEEIEKAREFSLQAQKLEAIGQLTGGIAHDFNNLLMAVLGSLELLRKRLPDDRKSVALLENAAQGAQRGTTLTKRMLAFARNYELTMEAIDVPELVHGMKELLERSIGPSFNIETRFPLSLKPVETDANQLELALLNLSLNARDAMPEGGDIVLAAREENIHAGHRSGLEAGRYIRLSVTDTGEGMDQETLRKATEPFFTTKGVGKGTGLGLSMVHGFAEQSGGRFILHSQKGVGTTAELLLPVAKISAQPIATAPAAPAKAVRPLTILAVDDDALVLMNTVTMLEDLGHTVFEAYSGNEALEILRREDSVDLVVTDQAMPKMTGTELAKVTRREWPDIPVLLATGYADRVRDDDIGLPKVTKPYMQRELADAIARMNPPRRKVDRVVPLRTGKNRGQPQ